MMAVPDGVKLHLSERRRITLTLDTYARHLRGQRWLLPVPVCTPESRASVEAVSGGRGAAAACQSVWGIGCSSCSCNPCQGQPADALHGHASAAPQLTSQPSSWQQSTPACNLGQGHGSITLCLARTTDLGELRPLLRPLKPGHPPSNRNRLADLASAADEPAAGLPGPERECGGCSRNLRPGRHAAGKQHALPPGPHVRLT